ncbi:MAG: hypothetical protein FRX49_06674 [Trebouxia sp. A1-2]|nr:MAG: hypothetical protein FRX49_06674 [Trebouxia sp. A1-2]
MEAELAAAEMVSSLEDKLLSRGLCLAEAGGPRFASSSRLGALASSGGRALGTVVLRQGGYEQHFQLQARPQLFDGKPAREEKGHVSMMKVLGTHWKRKMYGMDNITICYTVNRPYMQQSAESTGALRPANAQPNVNRV